MKAWDMHYLFRHQTDPYFNIAAEEYLLKHGHVPLFMLWINEPCIVIGKHQNPYQEINYPFIEKTGIPVIRRISGGGAVYHDTGNLNFSFIHPAVKENPVNFSGFASIIISLLNRLGVSVHSGKRDNLYLDDLKISGNAEHIFKDKVLHHGTLLFSTNLLNLNKSLELNDNKFAGKAPRSIKSEVANLSPLLPKGWTIQTFAKKLLKEFIHAHPDALEYRLSQTDISAIHDLVQNKYKTWQWNFGYSPKYSVISKWKMSGSEIQFSLFIENGIIQKIEVDDDVQGIRQIMEKALVGCRHEKEDIAACFHQEGSRLPELFPDTHDFINSLF